jgi:hypothetical protein
LQVLKLPQSSVDFHALVMVYFCGHDPATVASVKVIVGVTSQLSLEDGDPVLAGSVLAVHCTVTLAGQVIVGAILSTTVTTWTQELELPHSSKVVQVLVIVLFCGQVGEITTASA